MIDKTLKLLKRIDHRLFFALLFMGLCPTVYTTVRTFFIGTLPGEWSYSIAGQLSWINLIYEVINEAIILPLYFFFGGALTDKKESELLFLRFFLTHKHLYSKLIEWF